MTRPILRFAYDYIDPASWLAFNVLEEATEEGGAFENAFDLLHHPLEVRSPPRPLLDPQEPEWQAYAAEMAVEAARSGIPMNPPNVIPWSRKAHELSLFAREKGCFREVHRSLFQAYFAQGLDIGRIDVLVEIGVESGLDRTETRAVLDVDRLAEGVVEWRLEAEKLEIVGVPTLHCAGERLEGFTHRETLLGFLDAIVHLNPR